MRYNDEIQAQFSQDEESSMNGYLEKGSKALGKTADSVVFSRCEKSRAMEGIDLEGLTPETRVGSRELV